MAVALWAVATLGPPVGARWLGAVGERAQEVASSMTARSLANALWAFAAISTRQGGSAAERRGESWRPPRGLTDAMSQRALSLCGGAEEKESQDTQQSCDDGAGAGAGPGFSAQGVANVLWAFASLGRRPRADLFRRLCGRVERIWREFSAQHVANSLWACACLALRHHGLDCALLLSYI